MSCEMSYLCQCRAVSDTGVGYHCIASDCSSWQDVYSWGAFIRTLQFELAGLHVVCICCQYSLTPLSLRFLSRHTFLPLSLFTFNSSPSHLPSVQQTRAPTHRHKNIDILLHSQSTLAPPTHTLIFAHPNPHLPLHTSTQLAQHSIYSSM
jgi:hypothetical protein